MCNYLDLPNEVKLKILSELPAKEFQLCRRTCKHLRDLIDEKSNTTLLFKPGQDRARHRLSESLAAATNFKGVDFLDALAIWISRRGIWIEGGLRCKVLYTFATHFASDNRHSTKIGTEVVIHRLLWLAECLVALHVGLYIKDYHEDFYIGRFIGAVKDADHLLDRMYNAEEVLEQINITKETVRGYGEQIISSPKRLASPKVPADELKVPKWPVTRLKYWDIEKEVRDIRGKASFERIHVAKSLSPGLLEFLDIPAIPKSCISTIAYCVRTNWAYNTIRNLCYASTFAGAWSLYMRTVVSGEFLLEDLAMYSGLRSLEEIQKTAIMEEMYLF